MEGRIAGEASGLNDRRVFKTGRTATQWRRAETMLGNVAWALLAVAVPFMVAATQGVGWAIPVFVSGYFFGLSCVSFSNMGLGAAAAEAAETRAGYTRWALPHRPEVDLVVPPTGIVIRAAGDPAITQEQYEAAVRQLRANVHGDKGRRVQ